MNDLITVT